MFRLDSAEELLERAEKENASISEIVLRWQVDEARMERKIIYEKIKMNCMK